MKYPTFKTVLAAILKHLGLTKVAVEKLTEQNAIIIKADSIRDYCMGRSMPVQYERFQSLCGAIMDYADRKSELSKDIFISALLNECSDLKSEISTIAEKYDEDGDLSSIIKEILELAWQTEHCKEVENEVTATVDATENRRTNAVVFDFDGTLTSSNFIRTTWESIWETLGYDVELCRQLHNRFDKKEITHQEWCDITAKYFIEKRLNKSQLQPIIDKITFIDDIAEVFEMLDRRDIKIFIVSGSILYIIRNALGSLCQLTTAIKANIFDFNADGYLERIVGTQFDFEGKAKYIQEIAKTLGIKAQTILFVGNSFNDEFAHESGCQTLCINPRQTSAHDKQKWHNCIEECKSLKEIFRFIIQE